MAINIEKVRVPFRCPEIGSDVQCNICTVEGSSVEKALKIYYSK